MFKKQYLLIEIFDIHEMQKLMKDKRVDGKYKHK